jgi:hypothetical protein
VHCNASELGASGVWEPGEDGSARQPEAGLSVIEGDAQAGMGAQRGGVLSPAGGQKALAINRGSGQDPESR